MLILHSKASVTNIHDKKQIQSRDAILQVEDVKKISSNILGSVTSVSVEGGLHDLVLSEKSVREHVYEVIFDWLKDVLLHRK